MRPRSGCPAPAPRHRGPPSASEPRVPFWGDARGEFGMGVVAVRRFGVQAELVLGAPRGAAAGAGASLASSGSQCCHLQGPVPATQHPSPRTGCPGMCWVPGAAPGRVPLPAPGSSGWVSISLPPRGPSPPLNFLMLLLRRVRQGRFSPLATGKLRQERAPTELPLLLEHPKYLSTYFPPTQSSS